MSYSEAIEISEASNCTPSYMYVFVDFIYNHMHEADNRHWSFSSADTIVLFFEQ